jgi:biopolymer transport protein ExbD
MSIGKGRYGFLKKRRAPEEMGLQITSMADVFTIILVFLLKSFGSSSINITPSQGLKLPEAMAGDQHVEALKIEVSENAVSVEDKPVATLAAFRFGPKDVGTNGVSEALSGALKTARAKQELIAKSNPEVKVDSKILVIADQRVPYVTIKSVLASASVHGFTDFKLVVARKE